MLPPLFLHCFGMCHEQLLVILGGLPALASAYFLKMVCLPISWASFAVCQASSWFMWISKVFTVYGSFSSVWFCSVECTVLLFMPFHGVKLFSILLWVLWACAVLSALPFYWCSLISYFSLGRNLKSPRGEIWSPYVQNIFTFLFFSIITWS